MPRDPIPFSAPDLSALAKALRRELASRDALPSHLDLLNMLARAAGRRNHQHLRAQALAGPAVPGAPPPPLADDPVVLKALRHFDGGGGLVRWPARTRLQHLCLWVPWSRIPRGRSFSEREISAHLNTLHGFRDAAIMRRTLCALGLMTRTADGRVYRRVEVAPSPEGLALIRRVGSAAAAQR
ncbi:DUF2087 domain-containing protein [Methylobacterium oryzihabitans]|uniref:DUF2087 domain-containing protein n=1 Tax=Methylobacterium oryzihabitans TaxID=2499852 RepID=A0A3S2WGA1_9HYPH|nr:DUF2087 domain-containing protein [Methylobacterium oryzihabitans]RVU21591.1 DUF2087 domain-containing protein [Methylobacterium oryzihabitans]